MPHLSVAARLAFSIGAGEAEALDSEFIDTEHLFLGLCKVEDLLFADGKALANLDDDQWEQAREEIQNFREALHKFLDCRRARRRFRKILRDNMERKGRFCGHRTDRCREVFAAAGTVCHNTADNEVALRHFWVAVLAQESPLLDLLLAELGVTRDALRGIFPEGAVKITPAVEAAGGREQPGAEAAVKAGSKTPFLDRYGRDLTRLAAEGKLEPVIGRKEEMRKVARILVQKQKNNPILVGEPGVGKTCIVEGLAQRAAEPGAFSAVENLRIIEVSMSSLVAGTKYRGEFEEKLERLVKEASSDPNIVLFIDEAHTVIGAGGGEAMNAANILKPALARGTIKCIGATTTAEYRRFIEKDPALERRFQLVWVDEPSPGETVSILKGLRPGYEKHYGMSLPDQVLEQAVALAVRYLTEFRLPDKAVNLIDQACAQSFLKTISREDMESCARGKPAKELSLEDVARVVAERCRVPVEKLTAEESTKYMEMEKHLRRRVKGQDRAVREVAETIRMAKAGLRAEGKPAGVFLFLGATGTGKTELAKTLAEFLFGDEKKLLAFDMSEYQEKHSIARLIGAPPGYVGHEEEGQLTGKVKTNPYSVVLFDEIEKAHPEVLDLFLQIFDEGRLTDARGRTADFSETIIILTSNLGSAVPDRMKQQIGVNFIASSTGPGRTKSMKETGGSPPRGIETKQQTKWRDYEKQIMETVKGTLRPELLNRIAKKLIFYPLEKQTVREIVRKILDGYNERLTSRKITVQLDDSAVEFLLDKGYDVKYGAREMQRVFEQYIGEPLSREILGGKINPGCRVEFRTDGDKIIFVEQ